MMANTDHYSHVKNIDLKKEGIDYSQVDWSKMENEIILLEKRYGADFIPIAVKPYKFEIILRAS